MRNAIDRADVGDFLQSMQQDYTAANALHPGAEQKVQVESSALSHELNKTLETLVPFLPDGARYNAYAIDNVDVAMTAEVADGGQLILVGRHYIAFLRNMIDCLVSGITLGAEGSARIAFDLTEAETAALGNTLGHYLELGTPLIPATNQRDNLGPEILVAAIEFTLAHEITHRIEAHDDSPDYTLTGFQDYCRLRGREYYCDKRALGLILHRRRETEMPELAFVGAACALLAMVWIEQFTPGFRPGFAPDGEPTLHHPGSDSRLLRIHIEESLYWRAAKLEGNQNHLSGAVLRRAFRFMSAFEAQPKLIASPLNELIRRATVGGEPRYELFEHLTGEVLARGKTVPVARALGYMWGSSILMSFEEHEDPSITDKTGKLAISLFERMHARIDGAGFAASTIAKEIVDAKNFHLAQSDAR
jgi:hypothetical protein